MLLANGVNAFFIKGKLTGINDSKKLRNPPSRLSIFVIISSNKNHLFSKGLINFTISFTVDFLCYSRICKTIFFFFVLTIISSPASTKIFFGLYCVYKKIIFSLILLYIISLNYILILRF